MKYLILKIFIPLTATLDLPTIESKTIAIIVNQSKIYVADWAFYTAPKVELDSK